MKTKTTAIGVACLAIVSLSLQLARADCIDPTNPDCINTNPPPPSLPVQTVYTNLVGVPVLRFSISTSDTTNFAGVTLVATNTGFVFTSTNTIFVAYLKESSRRDKWYFFTWDTINTSPSQSWRTQAWLGDDLGTPGGFWLDIEEPWNGTGTNEHRYSGWILSAAKVRFFRIREDGPSH